MQTSNRSWRKLLLLDMNLSIHFPELPKQISWDRLGEGWRYCRHTITYYLCCIRLYPIYESVWDMIGSILTCEDEIGVTYPKLCIPRCWKQRMLSHSDSLVAQTFLTQLPLSPCCIFPWGDNRFFSSYWQAQWKEPWLCEGDPAELHASDLEIQSRILGQPLSATWGSTAAGASLQPTWSNQIRESSFDGGAFFVAGLYICCYAWAEFAVDRGEVSKKFCNHLGPSQKWMDWPTLVYEFCEWNMAGKCLYKHFVQYIIYIHTWCIPKIVLCRRRSLRKPSHFFLCHIS